jgi:hypothetical protein
MRRYLFLAAAAASAAALAMVQAPAQAATTHVLTIGKAGGKAVPVGAEIGAGLAKKTTAMFSFGTQRVKCTGATFEATVKGDPARPGTASAKVTELEFSSCTINRTGISLRGVALLDLPSKFIVSDSSRDPVKIFGRSKSRPLVLVVTEQQVFSTECSYTGKSITGHASDKVKTISFSNQKLSAGAHEATGCPKAMLTFSATLGALHDDSIAVPPRVYLN